MNRKFVVAVAIAAALTAGVASYVLARTLAAPPAGSPVPRVITYEGNLDQNGQPAPDATYSFAFSFWNDLTASAPANQVGTTISKNGVQVAGGKFVVEIPVDDDAVYETNPLYLELTVNTNKLAPRQKINAGVFAVRAEMAEMAETAIDGVAPGTILAFGGTSVPAGYLACDGTSYERVGTYENLFTVIGTSFGATDSSHFNVPDLRGRFLRGTDGEKGRDPDSATRTAMHAGGNAGDNVGSVQADEFRSHSHSYNGLHFPASFTASGPSNTTDGPEGKWTGTNGGSETRPMNAYVNFIIKY
ncbi:MAG: tail fiber protein [Deltaproteobacteria bacterium]|nr:tail fiber protein [Deltaproteobacteria bacterium]